MLLASGRQVAERETEIECAQLMWGGATSSHHIMTTIKRSTAIYNSKRWKAIIQRGELKQLGIFMHSQLLTCRH